MAEQGYSLESALADLIDNSISADAQRIEILIKTDREPFTLFLADDGNGMDEETLKACMHFPSNSPDEIRQKSDLGRFGLGMKTASFSQTRKFTVISRLKGTEKFSGRTWDLNELKNNKWRIVVNSEKEIENILYDYKIQSNEHYNAFEDYIPNVIVVWYGLYKFEEYLEEENRRKALNREITEVATDHLSLVFHRFMERKSKKLQIRVNNALLKPFNPFPIDENDFRAVEFKQKKFGSDAIKLEGFVLPSRSIEETKESNQSLWTTKHRSLQDMEGIYIYRANRIILFGGWNGLIKKASRLQLARLRVEIGNSVDHLLHLNVAKSQVIVPHELKDAFENYINDLTQEAIKEFYNRTTKTYPKQTEKSASPFIRRPSNKGILLEINDEFPICQMLNDELTISGKAHLKAFVKIINTQINQIRQTHEDKVFLSLENENNFSEEDLFETIKNLKAHGIKSSIIKKDILPTLGYQINSYPDHILKALDD
nr:ATP-binding protein [Sulfurospirillum diekertiae]